MSLLHCPDEILIQISQYLLRRPDFNAFIQISSRLYSIFNDDLYGENVEVHGSNALLWAAKCGHANTVRNMLSMGANTEVKTSMQRYTPLHLVAAQGSPIIAQHLLDYGADPEAKDSMSQTPLHIAVRCGHTLVMRCLVEGGSELDPKDNIGDTPLWNLLNNSDADDIYDTLLYLISKGADQGEIHVRRSEPRCSLSKFVEIETFRDLRNRLRRDNVP
ncbi:Uu.00g077830.m01.CDS01 [Anthostomella pinea]|uniref:Uu.00g077830.m01.CDS01 n=1 Tax=Anthostomella pinea TaxID=933095 RepID=A0AAI8VL65_9PEZI|nr:Uu.00g077830.m01.CDS01 [Anthostomella pinea]